MFPWPVYYYKFLSLACALHQKPLLWKIAHKRDVTLSLIKSLYSVYQYLLYKWGIRSSRVSFSSRWHVKTFAIRRPRGEPIATPSVCSYNWPSNWKSWLVVAFLNVSLNTKIRQLAIIFHEALVSRDLLNESHFKILRKCQGKFDCLVFEMLYIKKFKPNLNVQTDSIRAKLFV